jgi:hypothetical protein
LESIQNAGSQQHFRRKAHRDLTHHVHQETKAETQKASLESEAQELAWPIKTDTEDLLSARSKGTRHFSVLVIGVRLRLRANTYTMHAGAKREFL